MDLTFRSADEEAKMQKSQDFGRDLSAVSLDGIGGEQLAGSGFETEESEPGFSAAGLDGEE
jgi:hypothetical protein